MRGRPRKDEKNKEAASKRMQSYLQRGSYGFEVDMGRTQRVKHSPTRSDRNEKRDNEEEKPEERKRDEAVEDGEKIETEAEKGKEQKDDDQLGHKMTTEEAAPGIRMEGATLPTEAGEGTPAADENGKKKEEDATTGGSTGQIDTVEKKIARLVGIVGNLEARIERYMNENTTLVSELKALSIMCENDRREKKEMKKELKTLRTQSEEDRHRIDRLEVDLREAIEGIDRVESVENHPEIGREKEIENCEDINYNSRESTVGETGRGGEEVDKEKIDNGSQDLIGKREYLKKMPEKLGKEEIEWELAERKLRKKNIFMRGIRTVGGKIKEEIKSVLKKKLDVEIYIKKVRAIGGGLVLELESMENKIEISRKKNVLRGVMAFG